MALIPSSTYPAQIDTGDPAYPHGKARNAGSYQDGTGTPLEASWLNDLFGFQQALLAAAGVTPSGDPDELGASQYLDALVALMSLKVAVYSVAGFTVANGSPFGLTERFQRGGFSIDGGNAVVLPGPGTYLALWTGVVQSSAADNPASITVSLDSTAGSLTAFDANATGTRYSSSTSARVNLSIMNAATITDEDQNIIVKASGVGNLTCLQSGLLLLKL